VRAAALVAELRRTGWNVVTVDDASASVDGQQPRRGGGRLPPRVRWVVRDALLAVHHVRRVRRLRRVIRATGATAVIETYEPMSFSGLIASRRADIPLVIDDLPSLEEIAEQYGLGIPPATRWIRRRVERSASRVVAVSGQIAAHLRNAGVAPDRIVEVPNGIGSPTSELVLPEREATRTTLGLSPTDRVVVCVGSFQPFHSMPLLMDAMAELLRADSTWVALLVGDGKTAADTKERAKELGIVERIRFIGNVAPTDVVRYLAAADVCVQAGATESVNPMKLYEYRAAGRRIVAPDFPTVRAVIGDTGWLFPPESARGMAAAIDQAMNSPEPAAVPSPTWADRAEALATALSAIGRR
jgi:glycosyltransferase involved in cell wall biosynthesis